MSFSAPPGFPSGMRVLLIDCDAPSSVEAILRDCSYEVTCCSSRCEAVACLSGSGSAFDVVLAEASMMDARSDEGLQLAQLASDYPYVLMSLSPSQHEVLSGIRLGAAEYLEKPVCPQKCRTIWQHAVRKKLKENSLKENSSSGKECLLPWVGDSNDPPQRMTSSSKHRWGCTSVG